MTINSSVPGIVTSKVAKEELQNGMLLNPEQVRLANEWLKRNNAVKMKRGQTYTDENGFNFTLPFSVMRSKQGVLYALYRGKEKALGQGQFGSVKLTQNLKTGSWAAVKKQKYDKENEMSKKNISSEQSFMGEFFLGNQTYNNSKNPYKTHVEMTVMPLFTGAELQKQHNQLYDQVKVAPSKNPTELSELVNFSLNAARTTFQELKKIHERGIIHRDLHAGNILIDGKGNATIIDFGCAVKANSPESNSFVVGRSDIYSPQAIEAHLQVVTDNDGKVVLDKVDYITGKTDKNAKPTTVNLANGFPVFLEEKYKKKIQYTFKDDMYAAGKCIDLYYTSSLLRQYGLKLGIPQYAITDCLSKMDKLKRYNPDSRPSAARMEKIFGVMQDYIKLNQGIDSKTATDDEVKDYNNAKKRIEKYEIKKEANKVAEELVLLNKKMEKVMEKILTYEENKVKRIDINKATREEIDAQRKLSRRIKAKEKEFKSLNAQREIKLSIVRDYEVVKKGIDPKSASKDEIYKYNEAKKNINKYRQINNIAHTASTNNVVKSDSLQASIKSIPKVPETNSDYQQDPRPISRVAETKSDYQQDQRPISRVTETKSDYQQDQRPIPQVAETKSDYQQDPRPISRVAETKSDYQQDQRSITKVPEMKSDYQQPVTTAAINRNLDDIHATPKINPKRIRAKKIKVDVEPKPIMTNPSKSLSHLSKFASDEDHKNLIELLRHAIVAHGEEVHADKEWKFKDNEISTVIDILKSASKNAKKSPSAKVLAVQAKELLEQLPKPHPEHSVAMDVDAKSHPQDLRMFHMSINESKKLKELASDTKLKEQSSTVQPEERRKTKFSNS